MPVKVANSMEEFDAIVKEAGDKLVLVDFFATWCPPCRAIKPTIHGYSEEFGEKIVVVTVDVDEAQDVAEKYEVAAMPTFIFFKGGEHLKDHTVVGADAAKIKDVLMKQTA